MRLFEFNYRLKNYLQNRPDIPYLTGNYKANAFTVKNTPGTTVTLVVGDARQVPYAIFLERGFIHYRTVRRVSGGYTGRTIDKHKGWLARSTVKFAEELAKELGGTITYV